MADEVADLLERCRQTIEKNVAALDACCSRAIAMLKPPPAPRKRRGSKARRAATPAPYNDKLVSHLAWLTIRVAEVTTSLRQLEKHDRTMARTPEQRHKLVVSYIRQLDPVRRAELAQLIAGLDQERSVLQ